LDRKKTQHRQYLFITGIHQSKKRRTEARKKRRENNMTNEKIDVNKKYMENI